MDISSRLGVWNSCPKFLRTFQLHSVLVYSTEGILSTELGLNVTDITEEIEAYKGISDRL
jgi:hypothetical protein